MSDPTPLLSVTGLNVAFQTPRGTAQAVNGIDFTLARGEVLCLLGESGSGKSVTLRALMRLLPEQRSRISGRVTIAGEDLYGLPERRVEDLRGKVVSMVFQEPMLALDPVYTIGAQIAETIVRHERVSKAEAGRRALELLEKVQIPSAKRRLEAYPHEMSGGMRQRAMIALALACNPAILLADEPTTALDATVQMQVLLLLRRLQAETGMAVIMVTHDIGVAAETADRVAVMYAGRIVEQGTAAQVLKTPQHPYATGLFASTVHAGLKDRRLDAIPGAPPDLTALPPGCAFAPRCARRREACDVGQPPKIRMADAREVLCVDAVAAG
ncbi:ABC transporter ATP-binding protein [Siculibacillus lacustris]|uniref:ABC transporter ATP-binding protein n=1 Tax=Siculibacillus lacustris TaxID=1549641 RepID=A0A4V2KTI0_9HYPH|nr:ABC transporter ATP-binding protein [Siculibacillus lacustris]TBW37351.1 ABC transporter ATP-binding protein [Siculibacillus lacustris]